MVCAPHRACAPVRRLAIALTGLRFVAELYVCVRANARKNPRRRLLRWDDFARWVRSSSVRVGVAAQGKIVDQHELTDG